MPDGLISFTPDADGKRRFTNADLARMVERGLIDPEDRWELIRGEWFDMPSEGFEHMDVRTRLVQFFAAAIGYPSDFRVNSEGSFFFSETTELRPDLAIYRADVGTNQIVGDDLFLVAEIMQSSQRRDMELKRPIYAEAGVPELWLIDLEASIVHVFRDPVDGAYTSHTQHKADEKLSPIHFTDVSVSLTDVRG